MFKYILAATIITLGATQSTILKPTIVTTGITNQQILPKCIPRSREGPPKDGPIPPMISTGNTVTSQTIKNVPPKPEAITAPKQPLSVPATNLKVQTPQKPAFDEATIKAANTLLEAQWKAYLSNKADNKSQNTPPAPPAQAWLRYQQTNNLPKSDNVPAAFFQKWQSDIQKMPRPERPVGPDGKLIPFCDEIQTPAPK